MANSKTLTQRIALDGGEAIRKELEGLGRDGAKAFKALQRAASATKIDTPFAKLRVGMLQLRAVTRDIGTAFQPLGKSLTDLGAAARGLATNVGLVTGAAIGAGAAVFALAKSSADAADQASKSAQKLGLTIKEYGRLGFAAQQADVDTGSFATAITALNRQLGKLADDSDGAAAAVEEVGKSANAAGVTVRTLAHGQEAFAGSVDKTSKTATTAVGALAGLGIAVRDANGALRPTGDILLEIADVFAKMPDGPVKSATAMKLFGRSGAEMVPLLNEGGAAIRALGDDAERLGIVFTETQAKTGDAFGDSVGRLKAAVDGIKNAVGEVFQEPLTPGINALADTLASNRDAIRAFVEDLTAQAIPVIRDFFAVLSGRDEDVQNPEILEIRDAVVQFGRDVKAAWENIIRPALEGIRAGFDFVAAAINKVFGTDFTGTQLIVAAVVGTITGAFAVLIATIGVVVAAFSGIVTAITVLVAAFGGIPVAIGLALVAAAALVVIFWDDIKALAKDAADFIAELFGFENFEQLWETLVVAAETAWSAIKDGFEAAIGAIPEFFSDAFKKIKGFFDDLLDDALAIARRIKNALDFGGGEASASTSSEMSGFASGGFVRGPGTGTSDSILAWLSDGEYVVRAEAVKQLGVGFLNALNNGRQSFAQAFAMPRFADGGLVQGAALALAPAGMGSGQPVVISIDGERFGPMMAPPDVVNDFRRFAMRKALSRAGGKPSWHGRGG